MSMPRLLKSASVFILLTGLLTGCPRAHQPELRVTPTSATVGTGMTARFAVEYIDDRGLASPASGAQWTLSDDTIARLSVREDGGAVATGTRVGNATLTVNYRNLSATAALTVRSGFALTRLEIAPAAPSVAAGLTRQLTATGIFSDNTTAPFTNQVDWTSSDPQVLTVDNLANKGRVTGVAKGTAVVTATSGSVTAQVTFTVTDADLVSIAVTPTNPSVAAGTAQQFTATGTFTDNSTQDITTQVTWTSAKTNVATVSNDPGSQGLATGVVAGNTTITATLGSVSGSTTLTVSSAQLRSIAVTPTNPSLARGTNRQFTATGTFSNNTTQNLTAQVTWSSSDTNVATVSNTAGSRGLASALNVGAATLTATLGSVSGSTTLDVTAAQLVAISVTPTNPSLARGTTGQLTATGIYTDTTTQDLTTQVVWTSSDGTLATVSNAPGTQGLATALNTGNVTVSASQGNVTGTVTLAVTAAQVVSIAVTPVNPSLARGTTLQLTATGTFTDNTTQDLTTQVTWSSADANIAAVSNADGSQGLATAVNQGTATITAALGTITSSTGLTVTPAVLVAIGITPMNPSLPLGTTRQLRATGTYTDSSTQDLTTQVAWASSDTNVATVSSAAGSEGLATSVSLGRATITAAMGTITGSTALMVTPAELVSIAVTPINPSVPRGLTQQLRATGTYTDNTTQDITTQVTWTSSATNIATVSSAAGSQGLATAVNLGTATLTAAMNGITGSTDLQVTAALLVSLAITPPNPAFALGTTDQLMATGTYTDNTTQDLTTQVTWSSSDGTIASISNAPGSEGEVSANSPGNVVITAALGSITTTAPLMVTNARLVSIEISPPNVSLAAGLTQQFVATGIYTDNSTQNLTAQVTWASSNTTVASISNAMGSRGQARALAAGTTSITATFSGVSGTATLDVTAAQLVSLAITPANASAPRGLTRQLTATGTFTDNSTQDLTAQVAWSSSDPSLAAVSNVAGSQGLISALNLGTVTITAAMGSVSTTTDFTVTPARLVSIAVTPPTPSVARGRTQQFAATGTYTDNTTQDITVQVLWASSNATVAAVSNASGSEGRATALALGTATITAALNGIMGSTDLTVTAAELVSIAITPPTPSVPLGTTQQLTATGTYTDNTTLDLTTQVLWASSDPTIATVDNATGAQGLATPARTGTTTVTATMGSVIGSTLLTVTAPRVVSIVVTPANPSVVDGLTQQFTATGTFTDNSVQNITTQVNWASSDSSVATISNTAGSQGVATGVNPGTTTITAVLSGVTGMATLTVTPAQPTSLMITPASPTLDINARVQLTALLVYTDGTTQNVTPSATWATSSSANVTVDTAGVATGVATGSATIMATSNGFTGMTTVTVSSTACHVTVNEVQVAGATASDEFVEIYNGCATSIDLSGGRLVYRSAANTNPASGSDSTTLFTFAAGTSIASGSFRLYVGMGYTGSGVPDGAPFGTNTGALAGAAGAVALRNASGTIVDSVAYGTVSAGHAFLEGTSAPTPPARSSIVRTPNGRDTNNNAADFTVTSTPTPRS
ncbi:MAG TPA: Ig-like domain-containing protein [Polyangia bacterium]|nr:Ig-like domain-containing protein [Polyangia bacterium]